MDGHTKPLNEKLSLQQLQALKSLIEVLIRPSRLERELFFSLLLILMRENDFLQIKAPNEACIDVPDYILSTRKKNEDIYEATFVLNKFRDVSIKILAMPLANVIVLNAVITDTNHSYALCFEPNRFIVTSDLGIPCSVKNFTELKRNVKNMIEPIKSCILNQFNAKHGTTLLSLPEAVLLRILLILPIKDVLNLSESCKIMNYIVKEDRVWSRLYNRDFDAYKSEGRGLFDTYREMYVFGRNKSSNGQAPRWDYADYVRCANIQKLEIIL